MTPTEPVWTRAERDAVLAVLSEESKWCRGAVSMDKDRLPVFYPASETAVSWSLDGAIDLVAQGTLRFGELCGFMSRHLKGGGVMAWNDAPERTYADVRRALETLPVKEGP